MDITTQRIQMDVELPETENQELNQVLSLTFHKVEINLKDNPEWMVHKNNGKEMECVKLEVAEEKYTPGYWDIEIEGFLCEEQMPEKRELVRIAFKAIAVDVQ